MWPWKRKTIYGDDVVLIRVRKNPADEAQKLVPSDLYVICSARRHPVWGYTPVGHCDLRFGYNEDLYYGGHVGYGIDKPYRGHGYAGKAAALLLEEAWKAGMPYVLITCNPDNLPSKKTIERLGGTLLAVCELPPYNDMRRNDGETHKCVFYFSPNTCAK